MPHYGLWSEPDMPHKGWQLSVVSDLREEDPEAELELCEFCKAKHIRWVYHIHHDAKPGLSLGVGSHCAALLLEDYDSAKKVLKARKQLSKKRSTLSRKHDLPIGYQIAVRCSDELRKAGISLDGLSHSCALVLAVNQAVKDNGRLEFDVYRGEGFCFFNGAMFDCDNGKDWGQSA